MVGKLTPITQLSCSRLPSVMGYSPWKTPNDELAETLDALDQKPAREWTGNEATRWGDRLEPVILAEVAQRLGVMLEQPTVPYPAPDGLALNASLDGIGHPQEEPFEVVTDPDRGIYVIGADRVVIDGPGVLESKLTQSQPEDEPAAYRGPIQIQGCMLCAGLTWGAIGVLYRGIELRVFVYPRSQAVIDQITDAVTQFERRKAERDWYPPVSTADAAKTWATPNDAAPPVDLPQDAVGLIDDILTAKQMITVAEETLDAAQAALMEMLGNSMEGIAADADGTRYRVRWPVRKYKAQPAKATPAKEAYQIRQKTLDIKTID
ncbi:YqaJ viral recombinase [uncultured Caudovirales phage]|uniref:YqaJ viral recombinase n=1 Tax=uncultured Caudovirales phage TaxID=2100421 RepID=A0A6J7XNJ5_9CAUD|nr:YqaJ viral recombinase [uncultured Caudovirales phage]